MIPALRDPCTALHCPALQAFKEADIDSLLQKGHRVSLQQGGCGGGVFSKTTFSSDATAPDVRPPGSEPSGSGHMRGRDHPYTCSRPHHSVSAERVFTRGC